MSALASDCVAVGEPNCKVEGKTSYGADSISMLETHIENLNADPDAIGLEYMVSQQLTINLPNGTFCEILPEDTEFQ